MLIAEELWTSHFGRDPGAIGRIIRVSECPRPSSASMPSGFRFPYANSTTWRPIDFTAPPPGLEQMRPMVFARVKAGIPNADAVRVADDAVRAVPGIAADEHAIFRPDRGGNGRRVTHAVP
jgi:hypothetical protein